MSAPEAWLRGPIAGIAPLLQPAAHAFVQIREEMGRCLPACSEEEAWATPGGAPSIGYHARHLAGSTLRLLTYADGQVLDAGQLARLQGEASVPVPRPDGAALWREVEEAIDGAMRRLHEWSERAGELLAPRAVRRGQLPSTVLGLLFHAAEHAQRHAGQVATTARVVRGLRVEGESAGSA